MAEITNQPIAFGEALKFPLKRHQILTSEGPILTGDQTRWSPPYAETLQEWTFEHQATPPTW